MNRPLYICNTLAVLTAEVSAERETWTVGGAGRGPGLGDGRKKIAMVGQNGRMKGEDENGRRECKKREALEGMESLVFQ